MHASRHSHACRIMHAAACLNSKKVRNLVTVSTALSAQVQVPLGIAAMQALLRKIHTQFPKALADLVGAMGTGLGRTSCEAAGVPYLVGGIDREADVGLHVGASWDCEVRRSGCKVADAIRP